jgi:HAD superfamily hydrolase (TIGR01484 family)
MSEITPAEVAIQAQTEANESPKIPIAYTGSEVVKMLERQKSAGMTAALATDIDNTFRRKDKDPELDALSKSTTFEIAEIAERANIPIMVVTGREFQSVLAQMKQEDLPYVPIIAGAVGTELWILHVDEAGNKEYKRDEAFEEQFRNRYSRRNVAQKASDFVDSARIDHPDWNLHFQQPEAEKAYLSGQTQEVQPYKTSFYVFAVNGESLATIKQEFEKRFEGQKVVIAEDIGYNDEHQAGEQKKYTVDVLPVTKAEVIKYVQKTLGIDAIAVAGDGGNDKDMLTEVGEFAIQVGGSRRELADAIEHAVEEAEGILSTSKVRQADGSEKIYYRERGDRLGPESILRGTKLLLRTLSGFGTNEASKKLAQTVLKASSM